MPLVNDSKGFVLHMSEADKALQLQAERRHYNTMRKRDKSSQLSRLISKNIDDPKKVASLLESTGQVVQDDISNRHEMISELALL